MVGFLEEVILLKRLKKDKKEKGKCEKWCKNKKKRENWKKRKKKHRKALNLVKKIILRQKQRHNRARQLNPSQAINLHLNLKNQSTFYKTPSKNLQKKNKKQYKSRQSPSRSKTCLQTFLDTQAAHHSLRSKKRKRHNKKSQPLKHLRVNPFSHLTHNSPNPKTWQ